MKKDAFLFTVVVITLLLSMYLPTLSGLRSYLFVGFPFVIWAICMHYLNKTFRGSGSFLVKAVITSIPIALLTWFMYLGEDMGMLFVGLAVVFTPAICIYFCTKK